MSSTIADAKLSLNLVTALLSIACLCVVSCSGKATVLLSEKSEDAVWTAQVVAVKQPLGVYDAELRLLQNGKLSARRLLFGGRDEMVDISNEIKSLEFSDGKVTVQTRGSYGETHIELVYVSKANAP